MLAHLRCGDTYARLAAGFRIGVATVSRYVTETIYLPAAAAPDLTGAITAVLTGYQVPTRADRGYQGASGTIRVPLNWTCSGSRR